MPRPYLTKSRISVTNVSAADFHTELYETLSFKTVPLKSTGSSRCGVAICDITKEKQPLAVRSCILCCHIKSMKGVVFRDPLVAAIQMGRRFTAPLEFSAQQYSVTNRRNFCRSGVICRRPAENASTGGWNSGGRSFFWDRPDTSRCGP